MQSLEFLSSNCRCARADAGRVRRPNRANLSGKFEGRQPGVSARSGRSRARNTTCRTRRRRISSLAQGAAATSQRLSWSHVARRATAPERIPWMPADTATHHPQKSNSHAELHTTHTAEYFYYYSRNSGSPAAALPTAALRRPPFSFVSPANGTDSTAHTVPPEKTAAAERYARRERRRGPRCVGGVRGLASLHAPCLL
jgi:hypothetical protein